MKSACITLLKPLQQHPTTTDYAKNYNIIEGIYYKNTFAISLSFKYWIEIVLIYIHSTSLLQDNYNRGIL